MFNFALTVQVKKVKTTITIDLNAITIVIIFCLIIQLQNRTYQLDEFYR